MTYASVAVEAPVVVFVQVYYPDIWREMSELLAERLAFPFHLVVTSPCSQADIVLPRTRALLSTRFLPVENRGRDILPFLRALAEIDNFEIGLKLHTKKSPQREDGAQWRAEVLNSLLPSPMAVDAIVSRMRADRRIGLVTPAGFCLSVKPWILLNASGMHLIMSALGSELAESLLDDVFFAAGSMFWFRRSALAALADRKLSELFEAEEGQLDGTIAHAMERLFPVEVRRQGYVSLAVPALMSSEPGMPIAELLQLARRHADVPSRYFPGPYIPALPPALPTPKPNPASTLSKMMSLVASIYRASLPLRLRRIIRRWLRR
jgi:lipopolysaccharide biosynthesis protein